MLSDGGDDDIFAARRRDDQLVWLHLLKMRLQRACHEPYFLKVAKGFGLAGKERRLEEVCKILHAWARKERCKGNAADQGDIPALESLWKVLQNHLALLLEYFVQDDASNLYPLAFAHFDV